MSLRVIPSTLAEANAFVARFHRHHKPSVGHKFSLAVIDVAGDIHGYVIVGRPVARGCNYKTTAEVNRLATDGIKNGCSILYAAAARVCKEMGYETIQTYILDTEPGTSLAASGWKYDGLTAGGHWNHTSGPRRSDQPKGKKQRWMKVLGSPWIIKEREYKELNLDDIGL